MPPIEVILLDLPRLMRDIVREIVHAEPGMRIAGEFADHADAGNAARRAKGRVVIVGGESVQSPAALALLNDCPRSRALGSSRARHGSPRRCCTASASSHRVPRPAPSRRVTTRERQIVALLDEGRSNKEIAGRLCIEVPTVKNHVHNILEKLHMQRRGEAAALARGQVHANAASRRVG